MPLVVLRFVFLMVAAGLGVQLVRSPDLGQDPAWLPWVVFGGIMVGSLGVIAADVFIRSKQLDTLSAVYFGLIVGLFLTYVLGLALTPILHKNPAVKEWVQLVLGMVMCYMCISLLLQTKDDFRFIIPYVEFSKKVKGLKPYVLDTSVVIDGRIADVVETRIIDNQLVIPRFVISELQSIADSSDRLRRARGRRGLDILNRLRSNTDAELEIYDHELPEFAGQPVDLKLVLLAKHLEGKIVTNDYNLNKVSRLHGVGVVNLNDLANALKPEFLQGENIEVRIVKAGEEVGQGVGYLDDGTMIVVEGGRDHINQDAQIAVTNVRVNVVGEVDRGRARGQGTHLALGGEHVDLVLIQVRP